MTPLLLALALASDPLKAAFQNPPDAARPWVYWYFMEGDMTREGMTADLEAMRKAGLGGGIFLEVDLGLPKGPVRYMSPEWRSMVGYAAREADRLGLALALGTGPGWCGSGGPWVTPDDAMQHLVASQTEVQGPARFDQALPKPKPRLPYFGLGSLTPELRKQWETYYRDELVLAVPTTRSQIPDLDEKALVYRAPFTSVPGVKPYLVESSNPAKGVPPEKVLDLTKRFRNGRLDWQVPPGRWTILRFGRTLTGATTRPAPAAGLGFETDKLEPAGIEHHLKTFIDAVVKETGPNRHPGRGLTTLHWDSWEMGAQNASAHFLEAFRRRRGYDPRPYLPVLAGKIVGSVRVSERFLWDLRQTAQEMVVQNHLGTIKRWGRKYGLVLDVEPYDMNPTSDLYLGSVADVPMGEFWSKGYGYDSEFSVVEAVSVGHTNGRPIIGAEAFTADDRDGWLQHPASMKAQGDWALAAGINRFVFHRYQHQPRENRYPGLTMGPYGVHWERTETWWDLVAPYHRYLTRSQQLLRQGLPVADILYLAPGGAPNVFLPPADATVGRLPDRRGHNFDGCAPETLLAAKVKNHRIVFPGGMSYRLLVLPRTDTMTPRLLRKIAALVDAGATVVGRLPRRSPSLVDYPACDRQVQALAAKLQSRVVPDRYPAPPPIPLETAHWIWSPEGEPATAAPVGVRTFRKVFALPPGRPIASARAAFTADNSFHLVVNGKPALEGYDFHHVQVADVTRSLVPGHNEIVAQATNEGAAPNPAGLIGVVEVRFKDGGRLIVATNGAWRAGPTRAKDLGPWTMAPWNLNPSVLPRPDLYPSYAETARILETKLRTAPDLSAAEALRYAHRKVGQADVYFVANRHEANWAGNATFRVAGKTPEWWDPMTGQTRPLPNFVPHANTTTVPLRLEALQSGFVVFRPSPAKPKPVENFPTLHPVATLEGPWAVHFDPKFGGPKFVVFPKLSDWKDNPAEPIRHYSGKAVYEKRFDAPYAGSGPYVLSLGDVKNIAAVRLNGQDLGTAWCAPWRLEIPARLLKRKANRLQITVANLWPNRLIGDAALPESQRLTHTTWNPYDANSPLQPSGLLGPVKITH